MSDMRRDDDQQKEFRTSQSRQMIDPPRLSRLSSFVTTSGRSPFQTAAGRPVTMDWMALIFAPHLEIKGNMAVVSARVTGRDWPPF